MKKEERREGGKIHTTEKKDISNQINIKKFLQDISNMLIEVHSRHLSITPTLEFVLMRSNEIRNENSSYEDVV